MKRIIDGVTYNTDTATLIAESEWWETYPDSILGVDWHKKWRGQMYRSRGGAFFSVDTMVCKWCEFDDDPREAEAEESKPRVRVLTRGEAERWILRGTVDLLDENVFQHPPEAATEADPSATLYVRVPRTLKDRIDARAKESGCSVNAWVMRCVERCASS